MGEGSSTDKGINKSVDQSIPTSTPTSAPSSPSAIQEQVKSDDTTVNTSPTATNTDTTMNTATTTTSDSSTGSTSSNGGSVGVEAEGVNSDTSPYRVVADVDMIFEAIEDYESVLADGSVVKSQRNTSSTWTFRGVISGQSLSCTLPLSMCRYG